MQELIINKGKIYEQQRKYLLLFLLLFAVVNVWFAENLSMSMLQGLISIVLAYFTGKNFKDRNFSTDLILLSASILLPVVFSLWVGNDAPIWLFSIIAIFQSIYLINNKRLQYFYVLLCIASGVASSLIQLSPVYAIAGRATILLCFSFISVQTISYLLQSQIILKGNFTEALKMSHELARTKAFQRQIFDGTNYAIIAFNLDGIIIEFNQTAARLLEHEPQDIIGKTHLLTFFDKEELDERTNDLNKKYNAGIASGLITIIYKNRIGLTNDSEWSFISKNGQKYRVIVSVSPLKDDEGKTNGYVCLIQNITEKKKLEEQQHTAEAIIANSPSVLFKWKPDPEWTVQYVSANVYHLLGHHSIDFTNGKIKYAALINKNDFGEVMEKTRLCLQAKSDTLNLEYRIKHRNGSLIWISEQTFIKRNFDGSVEYFEGIITDITQRKKVEEELTASDLRYALAAQGTAAGLWDWMDITQKEQWWSPRFYELIGYTDTELPPSVDSFRLLIHPEDRDTTVEMVENHFKHNTPFSIEYRFKTKDGTFKWFHGTGQAHRNSLGEPVRMVGSIIDIDNKKQNESLLKESEERFRQLIESARDIFYNTNPQGYFTYANEVAVAITGYEMQEILSMRYIDLIREDYRARASIFYSNQIRNNIELTYFEFPIKTKYGQLKWIGQNVQMLFENNVFKGIQAVARDITELRIAQQQLHEYTKNLEHSNKELDEFANLVSHDLKTPLRNIAYLLNNLKTVHQHLLPAEALYKFDTIETGINKMDEFINGLLKYTRAGRNNNVSEEINTLRFVDDVIKKLKLPASCHFHIEMVDMNLKTDITSLDEVLSNLISNAAKHNHNSVQNIFVQCEHQQNKLLFSITDDGPGIDSHYHNSIFNIFQPIGNDPLQPAKGIGLAITKKILEEKNEAIILESEPGKGSKFTFTWNIN